jgi:N-acetylglucosamine-6-phosphate deacetylase
LAARPNGLFLVSDSMAFAGTELTEMTLGGRLIRRKNGRLTLEDGTLAGADLRLDMAVEFMIRQARLTPARALAMATSTPAALIGQAGRYGHLLAGRRADFIHIDKNWQLNKIWWSGTPL